MADVQSSDEDRIAPVVVLLGAGASSDPVKVSDLIAAAQEDGDLMAALAAFAPGGVSARRVGIALRGRVGRIVDGLRLEDRGTLQRARVYRVLGVASECE